MLSIAVSSKLLSTPTLQALVDDRIYPSWVRQADNTYPLIVTKIQNVQTVFTNTGPTGLESADLFISAIGYTYKDAATIAATLQTALDGAKGTWGGVTVQGCFLKDDGIEDQVVNDPDTEEILYHVKLLEFTVWYLNS